jgi:hypothetical protein
LNAKVELIDIQPKEEIEKVPLETFQKLALVFRLVLLDSFLVS